MRTGRRGPTSGSPTRLRSRTFANGAWIRAGAQTSPPVPKLLDGEQEARIICAGEGRQGRRDRRSVGDRFRMRHVRGGRRRVRGVLGATVRPGLPRRVHPGNWSRKHRLRRTSGPAGSTTSTNGPAASSSCSANRWRVGGRPRRETGGRRRTGRWRSPTVGAPLRRVPESHLGLRQPQHAHQGGGGVRAGPGSGAGSSPRYTPKHGSITAMSQCLHRRRDLATLHGAAWSIDSNGGTGERQVRLSRDAA